MSFAATLALVRRLSNAPRRGSPSGGTARSTPRIALWGGHQVVALIFASLVAGLATTLLCSVSLSPRSRLMACSQICSAMPLVSVWVMPAGLLALLAMPFGFDAPLWRLMGAGIEGMTTIALWVTSLPGALGRVPAFGVGALLVATAGMVVLCLLRSRLRFTGLVDDRWRGSNGGYGSTAGHL